MPTPKPQKVVILGGGFGGVKAALELCDDERFVVSLVSDIDHFRYYPALYHSATGGSRTVSVIPLSEVFPDKKIDIVKARAVKLDRIKKHILTKGKGHVEYDTLIVALGMTTNYFGIQGLKEFSYGIKSIEEAEEFKAHLHKHLLAERKPDLHYIVIGGGPTGVELAGALPSYLKDIMAKHGIKNRAVRVELIEAAPRILPRLPKDVSRMTKRQLRKLGVRVHTNQKVEAETVDSLIVNGEPLKSRTVAWTAGVTCSPFISENGFAVTERRKAQVNQFLLAEENIYVIGDNADTKYSGVAQTALYDAVFVADNLKRALAGEQPKPYKPKLPIYVTPTGPKWASVVWGPIHFYGLMGGLLRRLADLVAYNDYQPWWPAARRWMAEDDRDSLCPVCKEKTA